MKLRAEDIQNLVERCKKNNRLAQKELYEFYYAKMMGVALRYMNDRDAASDVVQDGFIKAFSKINKYTSTGSFEGWLRRIISNTAIDQIRKNKKELFLQNEENLEAEEEVNEESIYQNISMTEIVSAVSELSNGYRAVFNLYVMEGYTHQEIGEILGISSGTSKSNYSKAKKKLKSILITKLNH
jgi:RNA polymerase sigma factor (sigma-70 family)